MPPSDERIITPEQVAEIRATHRCRKCMGTGRVEHGCSLCGDSTYDHDCNDWSETCDKCSGFGGDADIDALLASHAALAERVAALEDAERIAWALGYGVIGWEDRPNSPGQTTTYSHRVWYWRRPTPPQPRHEPFNIKAGREYLDSTKDSLPVLTPDAREAIDAARKENNGG